MAVKIVRDVRVWSVGEAAAKGSSSAASLQLGPLERMQVERYCEARAAFFRYNRVPSAFDFTLFMRKARTFLFRSAFSR